MTPEELVVLYETAVSETSTTRPEREFLGEVLRLVVARAVPEPDHSMCARLVPNGGVYPWALHAPDGFTVGYLTDDQARDRGFAIPVPEPTVVERAAKVLEGHGFLGARLTEMAQARLTEMAQALADAGLLVRDGEQ